MTEEGEKIIQEIKARRTSKPEESTKSNGHSIAKNTREAIDLKKAEGNIQIALTKATENSKEVAGKHLAKMGAFYLLILVLAFIYSVQSLPNEAIAVVAGLVTLVISNLSAILKGITETEDAKDPIELMYDIAEKNSDICEREMAVQAASTHRQVEAITSAAERQSLSIVEAAERASTLAAQAAERQAAALVDAHTRSHSEMVSMLRDALEKQPTSLSVKPNDVVIKQGDNVVQTSVPPTGKNTI